jgi:Ser/Thr protein kinase RdoA (MazF antagonist)
MSHITFGSLDPSLVIDTLEALGLRPDGRIQALNSYENRVYMAWQEAGARIVAKFYRPDRWSDAQIKEEHRFLQQLAEHEVPVVAPLALTDGATLHTVHGFRVAVFPCQGGRAPDLELEDTRERLGRFIGRIHAVGMREDFGRRPRIDIASFGEASRDFLLSADFIPADLVASYQAVVEQALAAIRRCFDRAGEVRQLRLHGDCHIGNVLWTDAGPHFVDFDDSRMGPAIQDLWMLLSGDRADMARQLADLLAGYEDFCEFNERELYLIEALRTLRLIHYSAWLARRWDDPAFPAAFPWFNTQRYWQDRILELREQVALMDEPPLWPA